MTQPEFIDPRRKRQPSVMDRFVQEARADLEALTAKARAADTYLAATRRMSARQAAILAVAGKDPYYEGWLACLQEFDRAVLDASTTDTASAVVGAP